MSMKLVCVHFAVTAFAATLDHGRSIHGGRMFLSGGLQPERAAMSLIRVEEEWQSFAKSSAECHAKTDSLGDCKQAKSSFGKSCSTVLDAIVQGSSGDQNKVKSYMDTVCAQPALQGWHQKLCTTMEDGLDKAMIFNANDNRMRFHSNSICDSLWSEFVGDEQKRIAQEQEAAREQLLKANAEAEAREKEKQVKEEALEKERQREEALRLEKEAEMKAVKAKKDEEARLAREREQKEKAEEAKAKEVAKKEELRLALKKAEETQEKAKKAAAEAAAMTAQQEKLKESKQSDAKVTNASATDNATQAVVAKETIKNEHEIVKSESKITHAIVSMSNSSQKFANFGHSVAQPAQDGKIIQTQGELVKAPVSLNASAIISLPSNATQK